MPRLRARFRIPTYEEISLGEKPAADIPLARSNGDAEAFDPETMPLPERPVPMPERQTAANRDRVEEAWEDAVMPATVWSVAAGTALADQPVATLFARLWTTRPKGARPKFNYATAKPWWSNSSWPPCRKRATACLACAAPDSTYTILAVAWSSIDRILVRGLVELPK